MSRASTSAVRRANAFLEPSGLHRLSVLLPLWFPLRSYSPDQGVDLDGVDVIKLLESHLDLGLVGLDIDDEDEGVLLLDLLEGALGVERVHDDLVLIEARGVGDRLARVLGRARQDEGLGPVEGGRLADLGGLVRVDLQKDGQFDVAMWASTELPLTPFRAAWAAFLA